MISDRIWHLPERNIEELAPFVFPGWHHPDTFREARPIRVEYCSGNGGWIAAKAQQDPNSNWVAIEKRFLRARKIWSKVKNHDLDNLFTICGEGYRATKEYFPTASITEAFVNFPDPWPKRRHESLRIIQPAFIEELLRVLVPGGTLTIVTDDAVYSKQITETLALYPAFVSCFPAPYYATEFPSYGTSFFEDLWRTQGKEIHYHRYYSRSA